MSQAEEIIKTVARQRAKDSAQAAEQYVQLVVFNLDNEEYAVEIKDLQEIIKMPEITPVPGTMDFIRGIFNLRGKIVVVIDLEKRFQLKRQNERKEANIIVAEVSNNSFGVIVDKVTEIINAPSSSIQATPLIANSKIQGEYLKGVVILGEDGQSEEEKEADKNQDTESRLIILLDLPKMLQEKELMALSQAIDESSK